MAKRVVAFGAVAALLSWTVPSSQADTLNVPTNFDLAAVQDADATASSTRMYWDLEGATQLRSADVQETGTLDFKNFARWDTSSDNTDDDLVYEMQLQWGMAENVEMFARLPIEFGDGSKDSPDLRLGWQFRLAEEADWMPATAFMYEVRLPTGQESSGVDHEFRLIMTKTITPDQWRLHLNPFFRVFNGEPNRVTRANGPQDDFFGDPNRYQTRRDTAWGIILGTDYMINDTTGLTIDYVLDSGEVNGYSLQHEIEVGLDMALENGHELQIAGSFSLDGDSQGSNFGATVGYMIPLGQVGHMNWASFEVPYLTFDSGE